MADIENKVSAMKKEEIIKMIYKEVYNKSDREIRDLILNYYRGKILFEFNVAGVTFTENGQRLLKYISTYVRDEDDVQIKLEREEDNKFDPNAIKILIKLTWTKKYHHIGYVPKELAKIFVKLLKYGVKIKPIRYRIVGGADRNYGMVIVYDLL